MNLDGPGLRTHDARCVIRPLRCRSRRLLRANTGDVSRVVKPGPQRLETVAAYEAWAAGRGKGANFV